VFKGFETKRVSVGDVEIACTVGGSGPPVLLLHGYPQNRFLWARVAPLLAGHFTVVAADLRGYGDSSKPPNAPDNATYSFRAMAADQARLMQSLGFRQFHLIGHDRGGRTAHRLALDWPDAVLSLSLLDIVPTAMMFMETNRHVSQAYWHWYFLAQPAPFPETLIAADPDFFYETCLVGWGAAKLADFDQRQLAEYRRTWREPAAIHGSCSDYRAAATVDLAHDLADAGRKVTCPTFVLYGAGGAMAKLFDIPATWQPLCENLRAASLPGGHFFIDQLPEDTASRLSAFLSEASSPHTNPVA
jgi:haloacetate dehalogenase